MSDHQLPISVTKSLILIAGWHSVCRKMRKTGEGRPATVMLFVTLCPCPRNRKSAKLAGVID
jgi:hypothetical protein